MSARKPLLYSLGVLERSGVYVYADAQPEGGVAMEGSSKRWSLLECSASF